MIDRQGILSGAGTNGRNYVPKYPWAPIFWQRAPANPSGIGDRDSVKIGDYAIWHRRTNSVSARSGDITGDACR